jgi:ABC-type Co2+ transport system permease subunit
MFIDPTDVLRRATKYLVEGFAVALAAYYIPKKKINLNEIMIIAITAAAIFAVLDVLAPSIGGYVKTGMGIGIGLGQVGF